MQTQSSELLKPRPLLQPCPAVVRAGLSSPLASLSCLLLPLLSCSSHHQHSQPGPVKSPAHGSQVSGDTCLAFCLAARVHFCSLTGLIHGLCGSHGGGGGNQSHYSPSELTTALSKPLQKLRRAASQEEPKEGTIWLPSWVAMRIPTSYESHLHWRPSMLLSRSETPSQILERICPLWLQVGCPCRVLPSSGGTCI